MTPRDLINTGWLSLRQPKAGLRVVLGWQLSLRESLTALTLMAVMSAVLLSLLVGPLPPELDPISARMLTSPVYLALVQTLGLIIISVAIHGIGRLTKGRGTLAEAFAMMAWLEALLITVSVAQTLAMLLLPPFALPLAVAGMMLSLWLISSFMAELHGYGSLLASLLAVMLAFVAAIVAMVFVFIALFALGVLHV